MVSMIQLFVAVSVFCILAWAVLLVFNVMVLKRYFDDLSEELEQRDSRTSEMVEAFEAFERDCLGFDDDKEDWEI